MATPKIVTSGVTGFTEANMNKFLAGDGTKVQIKVWYASIIYSAGSPVVDSSQDSCGLVTGNLSYNGTNKRLEITLSGFTNKPCVILTRHNASTNYVPAKLANSNTKVEVGFWEPTNLSTSATDSSYSSKMNFDILIIGF